MDQIKINTSAFYQMEREICDGIIERAEFKKEIAELKEQIEDLKSDARVGQELMAALNNTHDIVRR